MKGYATGNRVAHSDYGAGTITSSDERYTVIEFDEHGRRTFITDKVILTKSDQPAPARAASKRRKAATPRA